jgi:transcriptional regulator with XRE-family HTH domain
MAAKKPLKAIARLRTELERRGLSQNELAKKVGTDSAMVSRWVHGTRVPGLEYAFRLEDVLGIPPKLWLEVA